MIEFFLRSMYQQYSSQMFGTSCNWEVPRINMGFSNQSKVVGSEQQSFDPYNIVSTQIQSQRPPGFCENATESLVRFQHEVPAWSFEFPNTTDSTVHSVAAESLLSSSADSHSSSENLGEKFPSSYNYEHFPQGHDKLMRDDDAATDERPLEISFQRNQREKQCCRPCSNSASKRFPTRKRRIRWTKDLHEPFMMIVNRLGGPEKAKPKAILEMMKSDLLSISHVKSHLQKCRSTIYQHKALQERSEEGHKTNGVTELQIKIHMQIEESRQLQLEVRRSIHQQLEMQRNLQKQIEQQREQLKIMLDQQKERTKPDKNP